MLALAFWLLCAASLVGSVLAVLYISGWRKRPPPNTVRVVHAALGAASLVVLALALALRRGLEPSGMGTAGFAPAAGGLLVLALVLGAGLGWAAWRRRRPGGTLVGAHAGAAITALALLAALFALR